MLGRGASVAVGKQAWEPIERALQMRLSMLPNSPAAASTQAFKAAGSATSTDLPKPWGLSPPMISRRRRRYLHYGRRSRHWLSCDRKANAPGRRPSRARTFPSGRESIVPYLNDAAGLSCQASRGNPPTSWSSRLRPRTRRQRGRSSARRNTCRSASIRSASRHSYRMAGSSPDDRWH